MKLRKRDPSKRKVFIQNLSIFYNGNLGMLRKEDCVALAANIMAEKGYKSYIAATNVIGINSLKSPDEMHTLPSVEIINFHSKLKYFIFMLKNKNAIVFGNARTYIGLSSCFFGRYRIFMNHHSTLPKQWWQRAVLKFFLKNFDAIKADTEAEKTELLKLGGLNPNRIEVIPIPIDHQYLSTKSNKDVFNALMKKFNLSRNDNILIFVAAMRMHKRPDTVLKAVRVLKKKGIKVKLLQVGKDVLKEQIGKSVIELAMELGISDEVICTGRVSDEELRCLMQISKIGIQSGEAEGQCIVAFEYAAAGIAECLSNIPSFDIFGSNVLRHSPEDYKKLAQNIEFYIKNPSTAKKHARANSILIKEKYDYSLIKEKLGKLLTDDENKFSRAF